MPSARAAAVVEEPEAPPPTFETTEHHERIFEEFREGGGHLRVEAFPGSGKTTTILRAIELAPEQDIWLATFAKRNQLDLRDRLNNPRASAQTVHSICYEAIRESEWGYIKVCNRRFDREDDMAAKVSQSLPWGGKRAVAKLFTKARELCPLVGTDQAPADERPTDVLSNLAIDFGLAPPAGDQLNLYDVACATLKALRLAASEKPVTTGIDYADMLFLPLVNKWLRARFDMVVVDEYQDLTLAQLLIVRRLAHPFARIVLVGDKHQAIFSFRGAGSAEVHKLMDNLRPQELPLPKTYRCPKLVVALAQEYAPGYEADPSAPLGIVETIDFDKLVQEAQPGDFILSRSNAPLMPVALACLRADKPAVVRGKDIATGLVSLVKKLATGNAKDSIPAFLIKVEHWEHREVHRLTAMNREDQLDTLRDKAGTLRVLAHSSSGVPALLRRLDTLFVKDDEGEDIGVVLSTVHKAKGLEADRVFLLKDSFLRRVVCTCGHFHQRECRKCHCIETVPDLEKWQEERNIYLVALTRTKHRLTFVR